MAKENKRQNLQKKTLPKTKYFLYKRKYTKDIKNTKVD